MKTTAIICELNPLHNGHKYLFDEAGRTSDCVIAVMSGSFTQRSEPALFDKYSRAADALSCGADIVVELPFPWSCASAAFFASAGVKTAEKLGADELLFASECGDIDMIKRAADAAAMFDASLPPDDSHTADGIAVRREEYARSVGIDAALFSLPNNILGTEYARAADKLTLRTVRRKSGDRYASAGEIRGMIAAGADVRSFVPADLAGEYAKRIDSGMTAACDHLHDIERLAMLLGRIGADGIFDADGGLGERIITAARSSKTGSEMMTAAKTKKYTDSRIRRAAIYMLLGVTEEGVRMMPAYTTLLGADAVGREYLAGVRKTAGMQVVTKPADVKQLSGIAARQAELASLADELWCECAAARPEPSYFVKKHPVIV